MTTLEIKTALDNQILALLAQGAKNKLWSKREIADGLGYFPVSICALERLQAAGKVKLTLDDNSLTFVSLLSDLPDVDLPHARSRPTA